MNTDDIRQEELVSMEVAKSARKKKPWDAPALTREDARLITETKIPNIETTGRFNEGATS